MPCLTIVIRSKQPDDQGTVEVEDGMQPRRSKRGRTPAAQKEPPSNPTVPTSEPLSPVKKKTRTTQDSGEAGGRRLEATVPSPRNEEVNDPCDILFQNCLKCLGFISSAFQMLANIWTSYILPSQLNVAPHTQPMQPTQWG